MAEDWRIAESRDQALLYVVLRAIGNLVPAIDAPDTIRPLHQYDAALLDASVARLTKHVQQPGECAKVLQDIAAAYSAESEVGKLIAESPPWKTSKVVSRWVSAGRVLHACRRTLVSPLKKASEPQAAEAASTRAGWGLWRRAGKEGGGNPVGKSPKKEPASAASKAPSSQAQAGINEAKALLGDLEKESALGQGVPIAPAIWCVRNAGLFRIDDGSLEDLSASSDGGVGDRDTCLRALVEWCGDMSRSFTSDDAPPEYREYSSQLAKAATALFGEECSPYPDPGKVPIEQWHCGNGLIKRPTRGHLFALRRLPLMTTADRRIIAKGWATTPLPYTLAQELFKAIDEGAGFESLRAAAEKAATDWRDQQSKSLADGFPIQGGKWSGVLRDAGASASALALVRLGTLFYAGHPQTKSFPEPHLRFVLQLDGRFRFNVESMPKGAATFEGRLIPYAVDLVHAKPDRCDRVTFKRQEWLALDVGVLGPPVRGAAAAVLAAIESLDWRLWFVSAVGSSSYADAKAADLIARALEHAKHESWEVIKRKWMAAPTSPDVLHSLLAFLYDVRLRLGAAERSDHSIALVSGLLDDVKCCEQSVLAYLQTSHPEAFARLYPPRCPDATYDLNRWGDADLCGDSRGSGFRIEWKRSDKPFGTVLLEEYLQGEAGTVGITMSAGQTAEEDLRILNAPFFIICPEESSGTYRAPLHDCSRTIWQVSSGQDRADVGEALESLRKHYLSSDGHAAFDALVGSAIRGDRKAMEWVHLLQQDSRLRFQCYPPIQCDGERACLVPATAAHSLEWQDDDFVPRGEDVEVFFSMLPERARRVLSRGRPSAESPERLAQAVEDRLREAPERFQAAGARLREATDRWSTFPADATHPLATEVIGMLLYELPQAAWEGNHEMQAGVVDALANWCTALNHQLVPKAWHPLDGTAAAECPPTDAVRFHPSAPAGNVVVERFGVEGQHASAWAGYQSAGPAPVGFSELVKAAQTLGDELPLASEVKTCLVELPRHYLAGKAPLAGPALFNAVWNLVLGASDAVQGSGRPLTDAVAEVLKSSCGMVVFEPAAMGEYPSSWVRAPDGKSPRGDWIVKVVRPGVRTVKNTLVWPAIVETE